MFDHNLLISLQKLSLFKAPEETTRLISADQAVVGGGEVDFTPS